MALVTYEETQEEVVALKERVKELDAQYSDLRLLGNAEIGKLQIENKALREALEWIKEVAFNYSRSHLHVAGDIYEAAKAALEQKETTDER